MHMTEGVHIAHSRKAIQKGALFRQKARVFFVLLGTRKVNGPVRYIKIPANHNGLALAAFFRIGEKGVEKAHFIRHTLETARGLAIVVQFFRAAVGEIAIKKVELRILQMQQTALALKFRLGQLHADIQRRYPAEHRNARVSLFNRAPRLLKCKPYAVVFAVVAFLGPGFLMPGVQINSLVTVFEEAFSVNKILVGAICCIVLGIVVYGSIKRIAHIAEMLAPAMCAIYILAALIIVGLNITKLPGILLMIVQSAFGVHAVLGGILGSAVSWGVKRGIYSNEAGMGCGAIVSAAAECSHPVKQGLIQSFSIYVDTLFIGTSTALIVLLTGTFDVTDGAGNLLMSQTGGIEAGIKWTQYALMSTFGTWSGKVLAIIIVLFVFTSMTGYCYQAESNIRYLTGNSKKAIAIARAVFLAASFMGAIVNADAVWAMGDIGYGLMAWANIIAIALLAPKAVALLKDYEKQKKEGKDPAFDPKEFGIEDETGAWK